MATIAPVSLQAFPSSSPSRPLRTRCERGVDGLLAFAMRESINAARLHRAGADRAPVPTGCNPGCKGSATAANSGQLKCALERRIPPGTPGSFRLGAGRSQVQILSPRSNSLQIAEDV